MSLAASVRACPVVAPRVRPGERPGWWDATPDTDQFGAWRAASLAHQVGVDALVAAAVELDLVLSDLRVLDSRPRELLEAALTADANVIRIGGAAPWRFWLAPGRALYELDELPELVLPARLIARLAPGASLAERVNVSDVSLALACDRRAARSNRTLEGWALSTAIGRATREH